MKRNMLLSAILSTAIAAGIALAPVAYADEMNKGDTMSHSDSMNKDSNMSKSDSMKKGNSDSMNKDSTHDNGMSK
jgi:pentapeptide MXKDX repeat protein